MADVEGALPLAARLELKQELLQDADPFITKIPKVELHVHIEGILSPALKWKFAQRNQMKLTHPRTGETFNTLEEYEDSHDPMKARKGQQMNNAEETLSFFEAYYGGFEVLQTKQDYFDLAMHYFEHAASVNVRYCEIFFDPQGHTRTGISWETMMSGFWEAQIKAEKDLSVKSAWIMCLLRDESPASAMEHYMQALPYRSMIVGIGLDSNEVGRPPMMFNELFVRARSDGFRITAHCDVGAAYPVSHIHQVATQIGGTGGDRIDHGLNIVEDPALLELVRQRELGMTICPWSYIRHQPCVEVFKRIRILFDAGIKIAIGSDDPAFMEDTWMLENLLVVKKFCNFGDDEIRTLVESSINICWADDNVKADILGELRAVDLATRSSHHSHGLRTGDKGA